MTAPFLAFSTYSVRQALLKKRQYLRLLNETHRAVHNLAVLKDKQAGDGTYLVSHGKIRCVIHIDADNLEPVCLRRHLLDQR